MCPVCADRFAREEQAREQQRRRDALAALRGTLLRAWCDVDDLPVSPEALCDNLRIYWFASRRSQPVAPYEVVIADYDALLLEPEDDEHPTLYCCRTAADEMLTADEAEALGSYLRHEYGWALHTRPAKLPIEHCPMPTGCIGEGMGDHYLWLEEEPGYPLSLDIWGHYYLGDPDIIVRSRTTALSAPAGSQQARVLSLVWGNKSRHQQIVQGFMGAVSQVLGVTIEPAAPSPRMSEH